MLKPTLDVLVAKPEMESPRSVVVPKPPPAISSAEIVEVEVPATVVVLKYKLPPAFRKVHWAIPAPAESAS